MSIECFLCSSESNLSTFRYFSDSEQLSHSLCKILDITGTYDSATFGKINYCQKCKNKILKIKKMLDELKKLEMEFGDSKHLVELQLKERCSLYGKNPSRTTAENFQRFRVEIVKQLGPASVQSEPMTKFSISDTSSITTETSHDIIEILDDISYVSNCYQSFHDEGSTSSVYDGQVVDFRTENMDSLSNGEMNMNVEAVYEDNKFDDPLVVSVGTLEAANAPTPTNLRQPKIKDSDSEVGPVKVPAFGWSTCYVDGKNVQCWRKLSDIRPMPSPSKVKTCTTIDRIKNENYGKKNQDTFPRLARPYPLNRPLKKCDECGKILSTPTDRDFHVLTVHRIAFKCVCPECDFGCQRAIVMEDHILNTHQKTDSWS